MPEPGCRPSVGAGPGAGTAPKIIGGQGALMNAPGAAIGSAQTGGGALGFLDRRVCPTAPRALVLEHLLPDHETSARRWPNGAFRRQCRRPASPFSVVNNLRLFFCVGLLGLGQVRAAAPVASFAGDEVVELPTYHVVEARELPPPEAWLYGRIAGFEVLSNASERATRQLVGDFQWFHQAVGLVWPGVQLPGSVPTALIICGRGGQFEAFVPASQRRDDRAIAGLTLRAGEQSALVVDYEKSGLDFGEGGSAVTVAGLVPGGAAGGGAIGGASVVTDPYRQLYREYIRFLLAGVEPPAPFWFEEGIAQIFMAMEVTRTTITVGKVEDPNVAGSSDFNVVLAHGRILPMEELFAVTRDSPTALNEEAFGWAKQCHAFVHWGLYGNEGRNQKAFITFLRRLNREPLTEALFTECFKQNYAQMGFTLRSYAEFTVHRIAGVRTGKGERLPEPPPLVLRAATEAEVGRIKGDALRLAGQLAAARTALASPYIRGDRDPALLAALGLLERAAGDDARARKILEAAVQAKAVRPRAYLELAALRFADAAAQPAEAHGRFGAEQTTAVLTPLFAALGQRPPLREIYELIAETWARSVVTPGASHLAVLDEGIRIFPRDGALIYTTATQQVRAGLVADAVRSIDRGLRVSPGAELRGKFETLRASLPTAR